MAVTRSSETLAGEQHRWTYEDAWNDYAAGRMSTVALVELLDHDEVFKAWCVKRAETERLKRDETAAQDDGA